MSTVPKSVESVAPDPVASPLVDGTADAQLHALDEIRSTAKWIAAAFAAVGGALITGISLSDLGGTTGSEEIVAVCGAALAIAGVLTVILFATRVLASPFVLLAEFDGIEASRARAFWSSLNPAPGQTRQLAWVLWRLEANRSLGTYRVETISQFVALLDEWREEQVQAVRALLEVEAAKADADQLTDAENRVKRAQNELRVSEYLAARVLAATQYEYVKQRFDTSRFWIVLAAGAASVGVLAFVLATNSPK